jgi:hypothetical protein
VSFPAHGSPRRGMKYFAALNEKVMGLSMTGRALGLISKLEDKNMRIGPMLALVGVIAATAVSAQEPTKQKTQDGDSPTQVGPASGAYKQQTDGNSPPIVGPASGAYKQQTQGSLPQVGPGSKAYKQN